MVTKDYDEGRGGRHTDTRSVNCKGTESKEYTFLLLLYMMSNVNLVENRVSFIHNKELKVKMFGNRFFRSTFSLISSY